MKRSLLVMTAVIIFSLLLVTGAFATTTRCVNVTGSGGCFSTIQAAVTASAEGDFVTVYPGVYFEKVCIDKAGLTLMGTTSSHGGTGTIIDAYSTFNGTTTTTSPAPCSDDSGIYIYDANRVTIKNLTVRNAASGYYNIYGNSNSANTTIYNVNILSSYDDGIELDGNNAKITNSLIAGNYGYPVGMYGDMPILQYNTITNNYYEVDIDGLAPLITNNTIGVVNDSYCLYVYSGADNGVVKSNRIMNCYDEGIYYDASDNVTISGNTVTNCDETCIELYLTNSKIQSNTVEFCGDSTSYDCIYGESAGGPNTYSGNIVKDCPGYGMEIYDDKPTVTGNRVTNTCETGYYIEEETTAVGGLISNNYSGYNGSCEYYGFEIYLDNATISGNTAEYNSEDGFYIGYDSVGNNTITKNISRWNGYGDNGYGGFYIYGDGQYVNLNQAMNNAGYGFYLEGDMTVNSNTANSNLGTGIHLDSTCYSPCPTNTMTVSANIVKSNQGEGIVNDVTTGGATVNINSNVSQGNRLDICESSNTALWSSCTGNVFSTGSCTVDAGTGLNTDCDID